MTFVVVGDDSVLEQVRKQLEKIVTVVEVVDISAQEHVERDLMLIKVKAPPAGGRKSASWSTSFAAGSSTSPPTLLMIEISGQEKKIEAFIELMRPFGIAEVGPHRADRRRPRQPGRK